MLGAYYVSKESLFVWGFFLEFVLHHCPKTPAAQLQQVDKLLLLDLLSSGMWKTSPNNKKGEQSMNREDMLG